jgi:hypothetical protein
MIKIPTAQEARLRARQELENQAQLRVAALVKIITDAIERGQYGVRLKEVNTTTCMQLMPLLRDGGYQLRTISSSSQSTTIEVSWHGN